MNKKIHQTMGDMLWRDLKVPVHDNLLRAEQSPSGVVYRQSLYSDMKDALVGGLWRPQAAALREVFGE